METETETEQARATPTTIKTVWPSSRRRRLKAPARKGLGSNPAAVMLQGAQRPAMEGGGEGEGEDEEERARERERDRERGGWRERERER